MCRSIIGGVIIALGLYSVVWGKAKDYSEPKLASGEKMSLEDLKIDIDVKDLELENESPAKQKLEEKETEFYVTKV